MVRHDIREAEELSLDRASGPAVGSFNALVGTGWRICVAARTGGARGPLQSF